MGFGVQPPEDICIYLPFPLVFRYYGESTSGRCEKCDKSCKTCRGPRPTDCQSCDTFFFLLRSKGQCHLACPEHYYADQHAQTCERCHPTCDKCNGKNIPELCVWKWKFEKFSFLICLSFSLSSWGHPHFPNFSSNLFSIHTVCPLASTISLVPFRLPVFWGGYRRHYVSWECFPPTHNFLLTCMISSLWKIPQNLAHGYRGFGLQSVCCAAKGLWWAHCGSRIVKFSSTDQ